MTLHSASESSAGTTCSGDSLLVLLSQSPLLKSDPFLLSYLIASDEQRARHALLLQESASRNSLINGHLQLCVSMLMRSPFTKHASPLEMLARAHSCSDSDRAEGSDDAMTEHSQDGAKHEAAHSAKERHVTHSGETPVRPSLDRLMQRVCDVECALAKLPHPPLATSSLEKIVGRAEEREERRGREAAASEPRVSLDGSYTILDNLVASHDSASGLSRTPHMQHPYNEQDDVLLADVARQQHVLAVLRHIRDALHSVQTAYAFATHATSFESLDALLQLPPDTAPLLRLDAHNEAALWCTLPATISLFTLWTALEDSTAMFACLRRPVVRAVWAAVLWMYTNAAESNSPAVAFTRPAEDVSHIPRDAPTPPRRGKSGVSFSPVEKVFLADDDDDVRPPFSSPLRDSYRTPNTKLASTAATTTAAAAVRAAVSRALNKTPSVGKRRGVASTYRENAKGEEEEEERWAYRDFPVTRTCTAPTVYDELFPLPSAVSAFTEPRSLAGLSGPGMEFYTGPSRRPQSLLHPT